MKTYRATILNKISNKKRRINIESYTITDALSIACFKLQSGAEEIIEIELWK